MHDVKNLFTNVEISLNTQNILFNNVVPNPKHLPNLIFLLAKMYIYKTRCKEERLNIETFKNWIVEIRDIEKRIAYKNKKLAQHEQKWLEWR